MVHRRLSENSSSTAAATPRVVTFVRGLLTEISAPFFNLEYIPTLNHLKEERKRRKGKTKAATRRSSLLLSSLSHDPPRRSHPSLPSSIHYFLLYLLPFLSSPLPSSSFSYYPPWTLKPLVCFLFGPFFPQPSPFPLHFVRASPSSPAGFELSLSARSDQPQGEREQKGEGSETYIYIGARV